MYPIKSKNINVGCYKNVKLQRFFLRYFRIRLNFAYIANNGLLLTAETFC